MLVIILIILHHSLSFQRFSSSTNWQTVKDTSLDCLLLAFIYRKLNGTINATQHKVRKLRCSIKFWVCVYIQANIYRSHDVITPPSTVRRGTCCRGHPVWALGIAPRYLGNNKMCYFIVGARYQLDLLHKLYFETIHLSSSSGSC